MAGLGTIVNVITVTVGCTIGLIVKGGIPKRIEDIITQAIGLATMFIGMSGALTGLMYVSQDAKTLSTQETMILIFSLIIGGIIGELIDIEKRLENLGDFFKARLTKGKGDSKFTEAFVTSSLLYCVGAMAIVGSLNDGLLHDPSVLYAKSVLDGIMAIVFGASLGAGVYLSCVAIIIYQGGITLLSGLIQPYLTDLLITRMSFVGSVLIFSIGINFIFGKKIKIGNLLPAMFVPILLSFFM